MTAIDFTPVLQAVLGLCGLALTIFGGIALQALAKKFNVQVSAQQTATFDDALSKSLSFGVAQSEGVIKTKGWDHVDTKNQVVGLALNYAVARFPAALKDVGLSTDISDPNNAKVITEALQRSLPAAMTVAAASPATPPAPVSPAVVAALPAAAPVLVVPPMAGRA